MLVVKQREAELTSGSLCARWPAVPSVLATQVREALLNRARKSKRVMIDPALRQSNLLTLTERELRTRRERRRGQVDTPDYGRQRRSTVLTFFRADAVNESHSVTHESIRKEAA